MTNQSCPVSLISVDANIARINAFYVGTLFTLYLITGSPFLVLFLIVDFFTRIFLQKEYSLVHILSKGTKKVLNLETIKVDAAPKRLAAFFGLFFLISIFVLNLFHLTLIAYIFGAILLLCIFLEVVFSYCLGCEIYHIYKKIVS